MNYFSRQTLTFFIVCTLFFATISQCQEALDDGVQMAEKRRAFAFAKRDFGDFDGRAFAFAKRSDQQAIDDMLPADKRFDYVSIGSQFAKRALPRRFAKKWSEGGLGGGRSFAFA